MHNHVAQKKSMDAPWRNSWQVALGAIQSGGKFPARNTHKTGCSSSKEHVPTLLRRIL